MSITVTVSSALAEPDHARIIAFTFRLKETDANFAEVPLTVQRGTLDAVWIQVHDPEDAMREKLLVLLLANELGCDVAQIACTAG